MGDFDLNSSAVQSYLSILQGVINRMSANSAACKTWCITLVSAILLVVADKGKAKFALISMIPTLLFFVLDTYYLALERCFRETYNKFIDKLHRGKVSANDLYVVSVHEGLLGTFWASLFSFSIWPFYLTLLIMICFVKSIIIKNYY